MIWVDVLVLCDEVYHSINFSLVVAESLHASELWVDGIEPAVGSVNMFLPVKVTLVSFEWTVTSLE